MARPRGNSKILQISIDMGVYEVLENDSRKFGLQKGAYISQLIMQKHIEMVATGLIEKMTPEQIQLSLSESMEKRKE